MTLVDMKDFVCFSIVCGLTIIVIHMVYIDCQMRPILIEFNDYIYTWVLKFLQTKSNSLVMGVVPMAILIITFIVRNKNVFVMKSHNTIQQCYD